jgi:dimethylargininase
VSARPVSRFNHAIVRRPAPSVAHGLRADDVGNPDYTDILTEQDAYIAALQLAGVEVTVLPALSEFPDAMFVEDPALVFSQGAILLRSGAASRNGETAAIVPSLAEHFDTVLSLPEGGHVEGGDVLVTPGAVMIGMSARTDEVGAKNLISCLEHLGLRGKIVHTPPDVLHFKTDCSLLAEDTVLCTKRLARSEVFDHLNVILVPEGEEAAANALRVNDVVMVGSQFPKTLEALTQNGYEIVPLDTRQIGMIDAGFSCMSLRWFAP